MSILTPEAPATLVRGDLADPSRERHARARQVADAVTRTFGLLP